VNRYLVVPSCPELSPGQGSPRLSRCPTPFRGDRGLGQPSGTGGERGLSRDSLANSLANTRRVSRKNAAHDQHHDRKLQSVETFGYTSQCTPIDCSRFWLRRRTTPRVSAREFQHGHAAPMRSRTCEVQQ
jgi:hypothetical protein